MTEAKKHTGGCHCGRVRYEVTSDIGSVIACNCSICAKKGTLLTFVPAEHFHLLSGEDDLTDYQFNKKVIHHLFCKTCGVTSFARGSQGGKPMVAINTRCLDDVDLGSLKVTHYDGKATPRVDQ